MDHVIQRAVAWLILIPICLLPLVTGLFGLVGGRFLSLRESDPGLWGLRAAFVAVGTPYFGFHDALPRVEPALYTLFNGISSGGGAPLKGLGAAVAVGVVFSFVFTWHYWKTLKLNEESNR